MALQGGLDAGAMGQGDAAVVASQQPRQSLSLANQATTAAKSAASRGLEVGRQAFQAAKSVASKPSVIGGVSVGMLVLIVMILVLILAYSGHIVLPMIGTIVTVVGVMAIVGWLMS